MVKHSSSCASIDQCIQTVINSRVSQQPARAAPTTIHANTLYGRTCVRAPRAKYVNVTGTPRFRHWANLAYNSPAGFPRGAELGRDVGSGPLDKLGVLQ
jgi:hypothetical protein